ncbi:hypothetical protein HSX10_17205 [Winogradskyella undariae]|uniref:hypothetical protein n=1 Tax=Winogradskyella undariae TaxID=1285465 RepID=UPI00156ABA6A|nr:hypothetical protein [Winogradskyella undariae]NRR93314.1 hypothetical protein [Winogradskyella undariae]
MFCILCSTMAFAQITDKQTKSIRIPAAKSETKKDSALVKIKVEPIIKKENEKAGGTEESEKKFVFKETEKPFSMTDDDDGLKSPGEIFENRWFKEAVKGGIIRTMSDQFLGEHRVDTKFVNIVCRDYQYPDGDRVKISVNGNVVKSNLLLTGNYRRVEVTLEKGRNVVEIVALNQGESGPNTAEFIVYDDTGNQISSKEWNLLTGVKATIVFNNEKVTITEKTASTTEETTSNN